MTSLRAIDGGTSYLATIHVNPSHCMYPPVLDNFIFQAMNVEGDLVGDFVFESGLGSRVLHCRNAPSPGATSSLAIARMMADKAAEEFGLPKRQEAELY